MLFQLNTKITSRFKFSNLDLFDMIISTLIFNGFIFFFFLFNYTGPREPTGAIDLINHYKLSGHYDFFCKRPLPLSVADTHYLHNVGGDTEIRKGEGMELGQLLQSAPYSRETTAQMQQFDLEMLGQAFQLRDTTPIDLPSVTNLSFLCKLVYA